MWYTSYMNIIVIAPTIFAADRGTPMRIVNEVKTLAMQNDSVTVLTYGIGDTPKGLQKNILVKRIPSFTPWKNTLKVGFSWYKIIADMLLFVMTLFSLRSSQVVHAHLHEGIIIAWFVSKILFWKKITIIGDLHGGLVEEMSAPWLHFCESWIHTLSDKVAVSSFELATYVENDRKDKAVFIPDMQTVIPQVQSGLLDISQDKKVIVYTGAFRKDRGIELIWEAMKNIRRSDVHWVIAGSPGSSLQIPESIPSSRYTIVSPLHKNELAHVLAIANVALDPKPAGSLQGSGKIANYVAAGIPTVAFFSKTNEWYMGSSDLLAKSSKDFFSNIEKALDVPQKKPPVIEVSMLLDSLYKDVC